ncbi:MAG: hypothetical protein ACTSPY_09660 [Candidatus Helarchaeota archaeon]
MVHTYGEIDDSLRTKKFLTIARHVWRIHQEIGLDVWNEAAASLRGAIEEIMRVRMTESIMTSKELMEGKITEPEKVITYTIFPPAILTRSDLQQGAMKLLHGESIDSSFILVDDTSEEIFTIINCHMEDGLPADFWFAGVKEDDELLDRRHMRLGYKLREIPKRTKNLTKCAHACLDILKDVRNERTPQWSNSPYHSTIIWLSCAINIIAELSNYDSMGMMYDMINAERIYKLPDYYAAMIPWSSTLQMMSMMKRKDYQLRFMGLFQSHNFSVKGIEDIGVEWLKGSHPEIWNVAIERQWEAGIPMPVDSLNVEILGMKEPKRIPKSVYESGNFIWNYPGTNRIKLENLGMDSREAIRGVNLDINHETPSDYKVTPENIVSIKMGRDTKILK